MFIDLQQIQGAAANLLINDAIRPDLSVISHSAQQSVGNARCSSATASDFKRQRIDRQIHQPAERVTIEARSEIKL